MASQHWGDARPGKGQRCLRGPWLPAGAWEGAGQIRRTGIDGDCFTHAPSAGSWHCRYQSPALPRCPGQRVGKGVRLWDPGWEMIPSPRASIGVVLVLCRSLPLAPLKAGLGSPPGGKLGRPHVTRADRSQPVAGRQEGIGGQGIPPVPGEMGAQHRAQGSPWAMRNGFGDARWLCAHVGGTPSSSGASCLATARGLALVRGGGPGNASRAGQELFVPVLPAELGAFVPRWRALPKTRLLGFRLAPPGMT